MSNVNPSNPNINDPRAGANYASAANNRAGAANADPGYANASNASNASNANSASANAGTAGQQTYQSNGRADDQRPYGQPYAYYEPYGRPDMGRGGDGEWKPMDPFRLIEELLPQRAKNTIRVLYGVIGVAAVILGAALLFWPGKTLAVFAIALGLYFLVAGIGRVISAIATLGLPSGWRVLDVMVGAILAIGGIVMLRNATLSGQTLAIFVTLVVGIGWVMEGVMALAESWALPSSGWAVLYAVLSIVAGVTLLFSPAGSAVFLAIFCGVALIVTGISALIRAFTFGRPRKR